MWSCGFGVGGSSRWSRKTPSPSQSVVCMWFWRQQSLWVPPRWVYSTPGRIFHSGPPWVCDREEHWSFSLNSLFPQITALQDFCVSFVKKPIPQPTQDHKLVLPFPCREHNDFLHWTSCIKALWPFALAEIHHWQTASSTRQRHVKWLIGWVGVYPPSPVTKTTISDSKNDG